MAGAGTDKEDTVLSYYCGINNYEQIGTVNAAMIVNLAEEELSRSYSGFVSPQSTAACVADTKGTVLSSSRKELLGTRLFEFDAVERAWRQQGDGYVTTGRGYRKRWFFT